jgi:hypothetical protein
MSIGGRRPFLKPPGMVLDIKPKTPRKQKHEQFTEQAIHGVIKVVQDHPDPLLKVSLREALPTYTSASSPHPCFAYRTLHRVNRPASAR